ncbi:hypothetical protein DL93DRAFT_2229813 [Clavulina sp. PMI_390]|nr:hypothetical protein DL93DRAFT_2229813 [Clavulina sp. PMI_390]
MLIISRAGPSRLAAIPRRYANTIAHSANKRSPRLPSQPSPAKNSTSDAPSTRPPPPTPYEFAQIINDLGSRGEIDRAIEITKRSALDSQSTPVWNSLLKHILVAGRYKLSYEVFTDMKRRGFKPDLRTYHTLLSGYSKDPNIALFPKAIQRANQVYAQYETFCESQPRGSVQLSPKPANAYLSCLAAAGQYEDMFDVFGNMPPRGPTSPDLATYTILINAVHHRRTLHNGLEDAPEGSSENVTTRNAADVAVLWKQLKASSERTGFTIDSYAIAPTIFALSKGAPESQEEAFSIIHDYLGLSPDADTPAKRWKVPMSSQILKGVLELCIASNNHQRCIHYVESLIERRALMETATLNNEHMLYVLQSLSVLAEGDPKNARESLRVIRWMIRQEREGGWRLGLRPNCRAYMFAFLACRRSLDWQTATKLFEQMSGYRMVDFTVAHGAEPPMNRDVPSRFEILPDPTIMNLMLRTAYLSSLDPKDSSKLLDPSSLYACFRIISHFGPEHFFSPIPVSRAALAKDSSRTHREREVNQNRLAQSMVEMIDAMEQFRRQSGSSTGEVTPPTDVEWTQWKEMKRQAIAVIKQFHSRRT